MQEYMKWEQLEGLVNSFVLKDSRYPWRILDAVGAVNKWKLEDQYRAADFTVTATGTSPVTNSIVPEYVMLVTTENADYAGDNLQALGSMFKFASGKPLYFGICLKASDATQSDLVVGLAGVDTTLTNASSSHALNIGAGGIIFSKLDGDTIVNAKTFSTSTEKNSAVASTAFSNTDVELEFYSDGGTVSFYYNRTLVAQFTADITTEVLTPSIAFRAGEAGAKTLSIKWARAFQIYS